MASSSPAEANSIPSLALAPPSIDEALSYWIGLSRLLHQVCVTPHHAPVASECAPADQLRGCTGEKELDLTTLTRYTIHRVLICCGIKQHRVRECADHMLAQLLAEAYTTPTTSPSAAAGGVPVVFLDKTSPTSTSTGSPVGQLPVPLPVLVADWLSRSSSNDLDAPQVNRYYLRVPAVAWNRRIIKCLGSDLRGQMISLRPLFRWNMACAQQTGRLPVVIFLGGTSGAGKSTLASLVASHLRIPNVLSTDTVRQVLRVRLRGRESQYPALFVSTYEAHKVAANTRKSVLDSPTEVSLSERHVNEDAIVQGYEAQCELVLRVLDGMLARLLARRESIVVEGVHLLPSYMATKRTELLVSHVACVPVVVRIPKVESHLERFCVRARGMSMTAQNNRYMASFNAIRTIQDHLIKKVKAASLPVLVLPNTNVDKSFTALHCTLLETMEYAAMHGWPADEAAASKFPLTPLAFTATKNKLVMVVRQRQFRANPIGDNPRTLRDTAAYSARDDREGDTTSYTSGAPIPEHQERLPTCAVISTSKHDAAPRARSAALLGVVQRCLLEQGLRYHACTDGVSNILASCHTDNPPLTCAAARHSSTTESMWHISASFPSHFFSPNRSDELDEVEVPSLIGS